MSLKPFEEFAQEPLIFPIRDKLYEVPPVGFREGIRLQNILAGQDESLETPQDGWRLVLGTAWDEMTADNVPMEAIARAGFAAMTDFQFGREAAERAWSADPEALAAALTAAIQATMTETPSTPTAAVVKTSSPASTSGTRKSQPQSRAKAAGSQS